MPLPLQTELRLLRGTLRVDRSRLVVLAVTAVLAAFAIATSSGFVQANSSRQARQRAELPTISSDQDATFRARISTLPFGGRPWRTVLVSATGHGESPPPPGLKTFPSPGEVWVSPALAAEARDDAAARLRLPASPTGEIDSGGVESPDQLLAYVGLANPPPGAFAAAGWGNAASDAVLVPRSGLLLTMAIFVALPLVMLLLATSRASAHMRRRRAAALRLLGARTATLSRSASIEAGAAASIGAAIGVLIAALVTPVFARSGVFGLTWWPAETATTPMKAVIVVGAVATVYAAMARWQLKRALRAPRSAREGSESIPRPWSIIPLVAGLAVQAMIVITGWFEPERPLASSGVTLVMVVADAAVLVGGLSCVAWALHRAGERQRARVQGAAALLSFARMTFQPRAAARSATGLLLLLVTGMLGLAALVDLHSLQIVDPRGHTVTVSLVSSSAGAGPRARALGVDVAAKALWLPLQPPTTAASAAPGDSVLVGSCAEVTALLGQPLLPNGAACHDHRTYAVTGASAAKDASDGKRNGSLPAAFRAVSGTVALPGMDSSPAHIAFLRTDPPERWAGEASRGSLVFRAGDDRATQNAVSAVLSADPDLDIVYNDIDQYSLFQYPVIARLLIFTLAMGLLIVVSAYGVSTHETLQRRGRDDANLRLMGAGRRRLRSAALLQATWVSGMTAVVGAIGGWMTSESYLALGGHHTLFVQGGLLAIALALLAFLAAMVVAAGNVRRPLASEHLRHE